MEYKIAILDDSVEEQNYILNLVRRWAVKRQYTVQTDTFSSAESFLFQYAEQKDYDILLLDIEMGKMDGVSLAKKLRLENETVQIIFITGFPDFMAEGYEVSALHYLMKPVQEEKLHQVLEKAAGNVKKSESFVVFMVNGEMVRVAIRDILYVEAFAHFCQIHTLSGHLEIRQSISELEKILGEDFIRVHRSYLVKLSYMKRISKSEVILDNGQVIPLSRSHYKTVNQAFIRYFRG